MRRKPKKNYWNENLFSDRKRKTPAHARNNDSCDNGSLFPAYLWLFLDVKLCTLSHFTYAVFSSSTSSKISSLRVGKVLCCIGNPDLTFSSKNLGFKQNVLWKKKVSKMLWRYVHLTIPVTFLPLIHVETLVTLSFIVTITLLSF